ncbi:hypothetical protein [Pseudoneobacillus sp. C159]
MVHKFIVLLLIMSFLNPSISDGDSVKFVELFDVQKDAVIQTVPHSPTFQKAANDYLNGINRIFVKINPIPTSGYMVRIPLEPAIRVKNEWINELVDEVVIVLPKNDQAYLMIFDDENTPHFFYFKGNTNTLTKTLTLTL